LSSWFFDFLQMCRDPGLSPLDPEGWADAIDSQLRGYHALFVMGSTRTGKAARDAAEELRVVLDGPEDAVVRAVSSSEEINGRLLLSCGERSGTDLAALHVVPEFRTLHRLCDVPYPEEVKLRFSAQEIQQELEAFEMKSSTMMESFRRFEVDLAERPRRRLELDARPFRRGEGSPAAFYHRLREVIKFALPIDIFEDKGLNFAQVRAFNPGPHPGPMICFYELETPARVVVGDPAMYDERELEEYGVVAGQSHCRAELA
jgi:hypothetical protein